MQTQPPDSNNPSNPLFKVAALDLDRRYLNRNLNDIAIFVSLNFKKSGDMRGQATDFTGRNVHVSFSLALKRATLDINFQCEQLSRQSKLVDVLKVAYKSPLVVTGHFQQSINAAANSETELQGTIGGHAEADPTNPAIGLELKGSTKRTKDTTLDVNENYHLSFESSNIRVTHAGGRINWEIYPKISSELDAANKHLYGEVFDNKQSDSISCACYVRKRAVLTEKI